MLYIKALHLIFIVTWFSGLFYIVRLFVYHSEAGNKSEPEKTILTTHFKLAEKRLWYGITWPSMIGTYVFGIWMLTKLYGIHIPDYLILKLVFVVLLTIYHLLCGRIFTFYQEGKIRYTSMQMRLWNEVATLFLVSIVFIVVLKDLSNWVYGLIGLLIFSSLMLVGIRVYKKIRLRKEQKLNQ